MAGKKATAVDIPSNNSPESANTESFQSWINVHSSAGAHETKSVLSSLVAGISNQPPILSSVSSFVFGRKQAVPVDNDSPELPSSLEELEDQFLMAQLNQHRRSSQTDDISSWISKQFALTIQSSAVSPEIGEGVDWDYWGNIINDYQTQVRKHPRLFTKKLHRGIPEAIRGMMWQLMSNSKSEDLELEYLNLLTRSSKHEKIIERDLARTFPTIEYFKDPKGSGQLALLNVLKAYSIYDPEVGYCQGIAFVMPEEQAFCVTVRLMNDYNFRPLYTPKMIGLQLRNYQFDKLILEQLPDVYAHLKKQDIESSMYASQWFTVLR